jgi:hypothetical protein
MESSMIFLKFPIWLNSEIKKVKLFLRKWVCCRGVRMSMQPARLYQKCVCHVAFMLGAHENTTWYHGKNCGFLTQKLHGNVEIWIIYGGGLQVNNHFRGSKKFKVRDGGLQGLFWEGHKNIFLFMLRLIFK